MAREKGGPHYVWGICTNLDKDGNGNPCPNCTSKEKIRLSIRDEFICPECGEPLTKVKGPVGPNWKLIGIIVAVIVVLGGAGFGIWKAFGGSDPLDEIAKIKLDKKNITLVVGQRDVIKATVVDKEGKEITDAKVTYKWTVKDEKVASVTQGGEVAALKKGKTSVTVKIEGDDKHRASCQIVVIAEDTVPPPPPPLIKNISITEGTNITIEKGGTKQLKYQADPEPNSETPVWVSSDPSVATVNATGLVTAVKKGKAQIYVKAQKVASAPITVMVMEKDPYPFVDLGYGIYEGPMRGGKANGIGGTIRFTRSYSIDLKKASGEMVEVSAGDKMINVKMENNRLIQGLLKRKDGSQRMIIIG